MSFVYFIARQTGSIKIGRSKDVARRFGALQTATTEKLKVLGVVPGGPALERELHRRFGSQRVTGEWFLSSPELLEWIEANAEQLQPSAPDRRRFDEKEVAEAVRLLHELASPTFVGERVNAQIERAAECLPNFVLSRIRQIWYRDVRLRLKPRELEALRGAVEKKNGVPVVSADPLLMLQDALRRISALEIEIKQLRRAIERRGQ